MLSIFPLLVRYTLGFYNGVSQANTKFRPQLPYVSPLLENTGFLFLIAFLGFSSEWSGLLSLLYIVPKNQCLFVQSVSEAAIHLALPPTVLERHCCYFQLYFSIGIIYFRVFSPTVAWSNILISLSKMKDVGVSYSCDCPGAEIE